MIIDLVDPVVVTFSLSGELQSGSDYGSSSLNFAQVQTLNFVWTASDNMFSDLTIGEFKQKNHQGISLYAFLYKVNGIDWVTLNGSITPTAQNEFQVDKTTVNSLFSGKKAFFKLVAYDFAMNQSSKEYGPVFFDSGTVLEQAISACILEDKTDADDLGGSPFDVSGQGYFDQSVLKMRLQLMDTANDVTQLSTLPSGNIPLEVMATFYGSNRGSLYFSKVFPGNLQKLSATYNYGRLPTIDAANNLGGITIDILTLNLFDQIEGSGWNGGVGLSFKLIDGAGNLSTDWSREFRVTVDVTPPTVALLWGTRDYFVTGNDETFDQFGFGKSSQYPVKFPYVGFSRQIQSLRLSGNAQDQDSGLPTGAYRYDVTQFAFSNLSSTVNSDSTGWTATPTLNLSERFTGMIAPNFAYRVDLHARNQVGRTSISTNLIILDDVAPTFQAMNRSEPVGGDYSATSKDLYSLQDVLLTWRASDNFYAENAGGEGNFFNARDHQGVYFYQVWYEKNGVTASITENMLAYADNDFVVSSLIKDYAKSDP
ncbi:MAG: hypothetical protein AABZ14_01840, partial [Candidatus Margulisiibacteriota bacterium]